MSVSTQRKAPLAQVCTVIALLCTTPTISFADANKTCTFSNNYCVPVIGCLEDNSRIFVGRSYGRREGPVHVDTLDGTTCRGNWRRTMLGGKANFICSDGTSGKIRYSYIDRSTGTATGKGKTDEGHKLEFWAGHRMINYFATNEQLRDGALACGRAALPMS